MNKCYDDGGVRVQLSTGARDVSVHHNVDISSGNSAYYLILKGVKRPGREVGHAPPSSNEVSGGRSYTFSPSYGFMTYCIGVAKGCGLYEVSAPFFQTTRRHIPDVTYHFYSLYFSNFSFARLFSLVP